MFLQKNLLLSSAQWAPFLSSSSSGWGAPHVTQDLSLASSQNSQNSVPDPNPPSPLMLQLNLYLFVFIISLQPMAFPPVMEVGTSSHNKCIFAPLRAYIIYFGGHISLCEGLCMCHKHIPESARALCIYVWASLHILRRPVHMTEHAMGSIASPYPLVIWSRPTIKLTWAYIAKQWSRMNLLSCHALMNWLHKCDDRLID